MDVQGRDAELARIGAWLGPLAAGGAAEAGPGGSVLVIEGEPGIGKTTLWAETVRRARGRGWQVLSCRPAPSDSALAHVSLADLLRPVPDGAFAGLPPPQRRPLGVALLREDAADGDLEPRAVGTALTALLATLADQQPLMLAVDDAQWLDPASGHALAFAFRRLGGQRARLLAAVRTGEGQARRPGVLEQSLDRQSMQRLPVGPLSVAAIHHLLRNELGSSFPRPVLVRIHRAAGGNPFYALEMAREIHRLGVPPPGQPLPVPADHSDLALLRLRRLPRPTRNVLAQVAAMSRPSISGLDLAALAPAERAGIVVVRPGGRVEFSHPLFGSALYASLTESGRRGLHRQLAQSAASVEERARHLALAADGPDEATAAALDEAADAAASRGAAGTAVELKELAVRLTPPADQRALVHRKLALADRRYFAGDTAGAREELERSLRPLPPGEDRAEVLLELGSVIWTQGEGEEGIALISQALAEAGSVPLRARIHSRLSALALDTDFAVEHGEAALALLDEATDPVLYSFALHNVALWKLYAGRGADYDAVERGMRLQRETASWEMSTVPAYWARNLDDFPTARERFTSLLRAFRERGDEASSCGVLAHLAVIEAMTGHIEQARALAGEALDLAWQTGQDTYVMVALNARGQVCAMAGDLAGARAAAGEILRRLEALPDATLECMARAILGTAALADGDLPGADHHFSRAAAIERAQHSREPAGARFHGDHVEAVIGLGDTGRAAELVRTLEERAAALPRPWLLAVSARSRGLLNAARGDLDAALADYRQALAAHAALGMPAEHGRTLLALGRLHRRRNERLRAQSSLAEAAAVFEAAGAAGWAAVARDELRRARGRRGTASELTPTERQVAELAVAGLRNHEIASRLVVSPKTVEANLSRVYRKLAIRSRAELAPRLASQPGDQGAGP